MRNLLFEFEEDSTGGMSASGWTHTFASNAKGSGTLRFLLCAKRRNAEKGRPPAQVLEIHGRLRLITLRTLHFRCWGDFCRAIANDQETLHERIRYSQGCLHFGARAGRDRRLSLVSGRFPQNPCHGWRRHRRGSPVVMRRIHVCRVCV